MLSDLDIIVTSFHIPALLHECLQSLQPLVNADARVTIVDSGSDQETMDICQANDMPILRVDNRGYSYLVNQAIAATKRNYVLLLNGDASLLPEQTVQQFSWAINYLREYNRVGALGLRHVDRDRHWQLSQWSMTPHLFAEFFRKIMTHMSSAVGFVNSSLETFYQQIQPVAWVAGSAILAPRTSFLGPLQWDQQFFLYYEDIDWCLRLQQAGYKIISYPHLTVVHAGGASTEVISQEKRKVFKYSQQYLFQKHRSKLEWHLVKLYQKIPRSILFS